MPEPARLQEVIPEAASAGVGHIVSNAIVKLLRDRAGRGPTKAKTVVSSDLVVVTLGDCLTTVEKTLTEVGALGAARQAREALHEALRGDATAVVEGATGRRVVAYLSAQHYAPDIAAMVFILEPGGE